MLQFSRGSGLHHVVFSSKAICGSWEKLKSIKRRKKAGKVVSLTDLLLKR
jgi:hypothetical protein